MGIKHGVFYRYLTKCNVNNAKTTEKRGALRRMVFPRVIRRRIVPRLSRVVFFVFFEKDA